MSNRNRKREFALDKSKFLKFATVYHSGDLVKMILTDCKGIDANIHKTVGKKSPLFFLCMVHGKGNRSLDIIKVLIEHGIDVNETDSKGKTPLDLSLIHI